MRRVVVTLAATAILAGGVALAQDANKPVPTSVEATATTTCQNCHGAGGNSVSATFPRLNGQQADYIAAQLKNFRDHSRSDPHARAYMWGMASQLDDAAIDGLAHYYANQKPTAPQTGGALAADGAKIYAEGVAAQNVPACQTCHGDHGEGSSVIPRLAGQHGDYLRRQLEAFREELRENEIMHANTKDMTDSQIEALVSYLAND
jgi:cytochrome c553